MLACWLCLPFHALRIPATSLRYETEKDLRKALNKFYKSDEYNKGKFTGYSRLTGFVPDGEDGIKVYWVSYNATIPKEAASGPASLKAWQNLWEKEADENCAAPCFPHLNNPPINRPVNWEFMLIM